MDEGMTVAASSHIASVLCDVTGQSAYIEQNADTASSRIINLEKSSNCDQGTLTSQTDCQTDRRLTGDLQQRNGALQRLAW